MDDEFDIEEGGALPDVSGDDEPGDETAAAAHGGLDEDEHISMRGELWSDEDESFEDSEAGIDGGHLQQHIQKRDSSDRKRCAWGI